MENQQSDPGALTGNTPAVAGVEPESAGEGHKARGAEETEGTAVGSVAVPATSAATRRRPTGKDGKRRGEVILPLEAGADDTDAKARTDKPGCTPGSDAVAVGAGELSAPLGRWTVGAVAAGAALFVGSAAFAGAAVQPYLADRAMVAKRLEVARTATAAVTTLWTYTPDNIDSLPDRAAAYLTGDLEAEYRKFADTIVTPNKQAQVTDTTNVVGVAVESLTGSQATVMVFTNTTSTSPLTRNVPSLKFIGYRMDMKQHGPRWLVANMATITFVDLTPKL